MRLTKQMAEILKQLTDSPLQGERDPKLYRPNAGLALFSGKGLVFIGRRSGSSGPYQWQMPQGGIDKGENPRNAAFRELEEETGIPPGHVELLEEMEDWLYYDFPPDLKTKLAGPYSGQRQKWFAFRFKGPESCVQLDLHEPEFDAWKWTNLKETPDLIVPFKQPVYKHVAEHFLKWTKSDG